MPKESRVELKGPIFKDDAGDKIDAAIAIIDGYLYLVIDWERGDTLEDPIEHTEKTVAFRITGGKV